MLIVFSFSILGNVFSQNPEIKMGIDVLRERNFDILQGKRVGALTHSAAVSASGDLTIDILKEALGKNLVAVFVAEHGINCDHLDGNAFDDSDKGYDMPIYAMYGNDAKPKHEWLQELDVVVIDLCDIGIRYYTFYASMTYMLAACAEIGVPVIILDRPNPLGGKYVGGPVIEPELCSFLGPIACMPMFHGMTIGEIANYLCKGGIDIDAKDNVFRTSLKISFGVASRVDKGLQVSANTLAKLDLHIVKMKGWGRHMSWQETGLKWTKTSPRISFWRDLCDYILTAPLCSIAGNSGFGIEFKIDHNDNRHFGNMQFRGNPTESYKSMLEKIKEIDQDSLAGCSAEILEVNGCQYLSINVVDIKKTVPALFGLTITAIAQKWSDWEQIKRDDEPLMFMIKKHIGDSEFINELVEGKEINVEHFRTKWENQAKEFVKKTFPYYLYE